MLGSCCRRVTFMWPIEVARHVVLWSLPDIYGWLLTCLDIQACQMCALKRSGFQVFVIGQIWYYGMCYLSRSHCCLVINIWLRDNAVYPLELSFRATRHLNHRHSVYLISCSWLLGVPNVHHFFVVKTSDINSPSFTASRVVIDMFRSCHSFSFCHLLPAPYTKTFRPPPPVVDKSLHDLPDMDYLTGTDTSGQLTWMSTCFHSQCSHDESLN